MKKNLLFIFGTRPEAIKLAPIIKVFEAEQEFDVKVCVTAQHREMLDQVLQFFNIRVDFDLDLMQPNQSLFSLTSKAMTQLEGVMRDAKPDVVFVQGDTTSVLVGALSAFYAKAKIAHIEAGLRSGNKRVPYPEEMNRLLCSRLADFHFTPTISASNNLRLEGISEHVYMVGNSVIDALHIATDRVEKEDAAYALLFPQIDFDTRIILVTCHRRENFGEPFQNICEAILKIANSYPDVSFVYPVHLNPNIKQIADRLLIAPNIVLLPPLDYAPFVWLMNKSYLVLTDSGGIQEEAPALGKPVLVLRDVTERKESIEAGTARLVGTEKINIVNALTNLLDNKVAYKTMSESINPYGSGNTSKQIVEIVKQILGA